MNVSYRQVLAEKKSADLLRADRPFVVAAKTSRMAIVFTDATQPDHPILFANHSFLKLSGYARDEVIGKPFALLLAGKSDAAVRKILKEQFDDEAEALDVECCRKDGGRLWIAMCVNPVHDEQGKLVQHFVSLLDLSAQVKRIQREREALHVLYEHTPGFIAITSGPEHRFTFANAAYHALVGPRELLGEIVAEALPEVASQHVLGMLDSVYQTGEPFHGTGMPMRLQRKAGADLEVRFLDFIYQPIRDSDGAVTGIFCEGSDVTDRQEAADQVEVLQANLLHLSRLSAMGTMAATLAHELTQPLTAISNYAAACGHLNSAEGDFTDSIAQTLTAIRDSARRGGEIIGRLKDMTGRRKPQREFFDLQEAVRESLVLIRAGAGACTCTGVTIEDRSSGTGKLEADRVQVQQVIMNLVRNGCEAAADSGGKVTVLTALEADKVVVSIKDSGKGISADEEKTLFTWVESAKPEGMGMGLSICRNIVEAHGGTLWLDRNETRGSCFSFSLPLHPAA